MSKLRDRDTRLVYCPQGFWFTRESTGTGRPVCCGPCECEQHAVERDVTQAPIAYAVRDMNGKLVLVSDSKDAEERALISLYSLPPRVTSEQHDALMTEIEEAKNYWATVEIPISELLTAEHRIDKARHHLDLHIFSEFSGSDTPLDAESTLEFLADLASILWGDGSVR